MTQVKRGAESWAADGGDVGVLLVHGYSGSPASLRPLAELLAARGHTVELPRLPGHGTRWQDLRRATWRDWVREVAAAHERLAARTRARVAVCLSFGSCLGLHLAATRGGELAGLVLVNPEVQQSNPLVPFAPLLRWVLPAYPGVANDIAKPDMDEVAYDWVPVRGVLQYLAFQRIARGELGQVTTPLLVFTSREDHVAPALNSRLVVEGVASDDVTQRWLERCYHVATLDHDAPLIEQETLAFVERVTAPRPSALA